MNRLSRERSPYLGHAADQPIDWYPWSDEAFERAKREDKPVFLSTGAVWCHWCHVMAQESFRDREVAEILNLNFISIKLDRDERPDIDKRYQRAVSAMGGGSGWPLSVFLTPDKRPFFGGTYFPPEDRQGRPGFKKVLLAVAEFYKSKRGEVSDYAGKVLAALTGERGSPGEISSTLVEGAVQSMLSVFDPENGGFGSAPKFPSPGAIGFLLNRYFFTWKEPIAYAVKKTLESMAKGGFHDQLGGGFHRYSTDEAWIVPHFEKMADDNAWLLINYTDAYSLFKSDLFRDVASGTIRFLREVLSDPAGGFFASQDADVTPDDEGGYFTWTDEDLKRALDEEEYGIMSLYLFHERGSMHHDNSKKVLFVAMEPKEVADRTGYEPGRVRKIIGSAREKLLRERNLRTAPFIDRTLYSGLNGMLISACLRASRVFGDSELKDFALKSLERIWKIRFTGEGLLRTEGVKAVLDDYIFMIAALIDSYELTAKPSYLERAEILTGLCITKLWDADSGGFFDTDDGILGVRLKAVDDLPHPSPNSVGIMQLLKLHFITGKDEYYRYAVQGLKMFVGPAGDMGVHAGYYFCSLDAYFNMVKLDVGAQPGSELADAALDVFRPYKSIAYKESGKDCITPCLASGACLEPVCSTDVLKTFLAKPSL